MSPAIASNPILEAAFQGLTATPKSLPPWLFYDERGSELFEEITRLPEYYLTRTERSLIQAHAEDILQAMDGPVTVAELGAGTGTKTGILLQAAAQRQGTVLYQPIDISPSALAEAAHLAGQIPGLTAKPRVANYITESYQIDRPAGQSILALYIGSSIGNFSPEQARSILRNLHQRLQPGDALLLGTDLAPGPHKTVAKLLAAYDDRAGVTAAFNRNALTHLNRELGTCFDPDAFRHIARWNAEASRVEMHLEAQIPQTVHLPASADSPAVAIPIAAGETIHTENSYKFSDNSLQQLLSDSGFHPLRSFHDSEALFRLTLAAVSA